MAKNMKRATLLSAFLTLLSVGLYLWLRLPILLSLAITAGTLLYHLAMRLAVGTAINALMRNRADAAAPWFRPRAWEQRIYKRLGVRRWRERMPTYDPSLFSLQNHTLREILGANCQAEVVHEVIMLLSFVPIAFVPLFGAFPVFLMTSVLAALYDSLFVLMQRYARPHLLRAMQHTERTERKGD